MATSKKSSHRLRDRLAVPVGLLLWACVLALPARAEPLSVDPRVKRDIESILQSVADIPITDRTSVARRVDLISRRLLGRPFAWNPIGEGPGAPDPDPLIESRCLDCQTFVELVIALARSDSVETALMDILALRYSARPIAFANRNHFVSVEWLPAAIEAGVLRDITATIPGVLMSSASITIDRGGWLRTSTGIRPIAAGSTLHSLPAQQPTCGAVRWHSRTSAANGKKSMAAHCRRNRSSSVSRSGP